MSFTNSTTSLNSMPFGVATRVVSVAGAGAIARRLMEMGVVPGAPISVIRSAPLGDPIVVSVWNYRLALRQGEAQMITVASGNE